MFFISVDTNIINLDCGAEQNKNFHLSFYRVIIVAIFDSNTVEREILPSDDRDKQTMIESSEFYFVDIKKKCKLQNFCLVANLLQEVRSKWTINYNGSLAI